MRPTLVRSQINKRTRRIVQMFRWAVAEELLDLSVHQALKAVEGLRRGRGDVRESEPVKPVPMPWWMPIRPHVARQVWAMIELQRLTGMRPGEVCQMRTCDINTQGRIWEYRPSSPQDGPPRQGPGHLHRPPGPSRGQALAPGGARRLPLPAPRGRGGASSGAAVRTEEQGQPSQGCRKKQRARKRPGERYDTSSYRRAIIYAIGKANQRRAEKELDPIPSWHPHQLRHSAATRLRREFGLDAARAVLGSFLPRGHGSVRRTGPGEGGRGDGQDRVRIILPWAPSAVITSGRIGVHPLQAWPTNLATYFCFAGLDACRPGLRMTGSTKADRRGEFVVGQPSAPRRPSRPTIRWFQHDLRGRSKSRHRPPTRSMRLAGAEPGTR